MQVQSLIEMARSIATPSLTSEMKESNGHVQFVVENSRANKADYVRAPLGTNTINGRYSDSSSMGPQGRPYNQEHISINSDRLGDASLYASAERKGHGEPMSSENQRRQQSDEYRSSASQYTGKLEMPLEEADDHTRHSRRIRIEPFFVPETSPIKGRRYNDSNDAIGGPLSEGEHFSTDKSFETPEKKTFGYDDEESFMLRDVGVDSFHGRIHYPKTWQKVEMAIEHSETSKDQGPDIIVTKPCRHETPKYAPSSQTNEIKGSPPRFSRHDKSAALSTGNSDRDDVMIRARALLAAHHFRESPQRGGDHVAHRHSSPPRDSSGTSESDRKSSETSRQESFDQDLMEDGVAPLGGYWPSRSVERGQLTMERLLANPINNLPAIHAEASRLLKVRLRLKLFYCILLYTNAL